MLRSGCGVELLTAENPGPTGHAAENAGPQGRRETVQRVTEALFESHGARRRLGPTRKK